MGLVNVAGKPLQPFLDAAVAGDTISCAPGTYAGPIRIRKAITLVAPDGATIEGADKTLEISAAATLQGFTVQGSTGLNNALVSVVGSGAGLVDCHLRESQCFGVRLYHADLLRLQRVEIERVGAAVRVDSGGAGSVFTDVYAHDIDRMVLDTASGNGGDAFQFVSSSGPISVLRPVVRRARAKASLASWQYDGGAFQFYNQCLDVTIDDWTVSDSVNVIETGKSAGAPDSERIVLKNGRAVGNGGPYTADKAKTCNGMLWRSAKDFQATGNSFDGLDDWVLLMSSGGQYAGGLGGNSFTRNTIRLKAPPAKAYVSYLATTAALMAAVTIDGNTVELAEAGQAAAFISGVPIQDPKAIGPNEVWHVAAPPDPCAELRQQVADLEARISTARIALG